MATCDNGGNALDELPPKSVTSPAHAKRRREKGVLTPELRAKIEARAEREKPGLPYGRLAATPAQQCAHPECSLERGTLKDPESALCRLHKWKKRYGIED